MKTKKNTNRRVIKEGEIAFTTGAYIRFLGKGKWETVGFEDDTYFNGEYVNAVQHDEPYIGDDEE